MDEEVYKEKVLEIFEFKNWLFFFKNGEQKKIVTFYFYCKEFGLFTHHIVLSNEFTNHLCL